MNMTGVKLKEKSSFGSLPLKILGFIAQLAERPAVNRKAAGSMSPFHSGRRRTDVPRTSCDLLFPLKKYPFSIELRPMAGQLSDAQPMYNSKNCFRYPAAPIMLLWRNGSAAVS